MAMQELSESQVALLRTEELACLGRLVAGIAHEINSPLGALQGSASTMGTAAAKMTAWFEQNPANAQDDVRRSIDAAIEASAQVAIATRRVTEIVNRLLEFAQLDGLELKRTRISDCLERVLESMQPELRDSVTVTKEYSDVPEIEASPQHLNRLFMHLLLNAQESIRQAGRPGLVHLRVFSDGEWACVLMEDNGCGIPSEVLGKVFDPGFTTRGGGLGTGLGLAICEKIVQAHEGKISLETRLTAGARVTVQLPLNRKPQMASPHFSPPDG